ncbi:MAG: class I SAM-dependent methyltransferase [Vicinamibacterales bacterium]
MAYIDFIEKIHTSTKRNYLQRVVEYDKAECAAISRQFGFDYFDGDRKYGYGGFKYMEGRWESFARDLARHYGLKPGMRVLDIGCAKGFLLHEFAKVVPGLEVAGIDISEYAIANAMDDMKPFVQVGSAVSLPYPDNHFDLVVSINTLHNLLIGDLFTALGEIERVGRGGKYLILDGYRNEQEKVNLMYWQLTCECFYRPEEWDWIFSKAGYTGDYACIYYE